MQEWERCRAKIFSLDHCGEPTYLEMVRQIGPYFLSQRIGSGGMAEVWMAHRTSLGAHKTVAIKLLASHLACKPEYRRMFIEEARLSMLLNNSRLVQVFDAGEYVDGCYLAMEWIDGVNLAELQSGLWERGCRLPVDVAMFITGEVLRALHYAHNVIYQGASSIVHRDVSPQNVMLSIAGEVKLADFGVARFSTEETTGLHVKGKLRYMPREQLQGQSRDVAVDVFAVGAILHEMLEGRKFRGAYEDDPQLMSIILAGQLPELPDPGGVSVELDALRRSMLMPNARERIPTALAAVRELERCPGFRNMSLELEDLIRDHRRRRPVSHPPIVPLMPESQTTETSVSRRLAPRQNPPTGTERRKGPIEGAHRDRRMAAALLLGFGGLVVGGTGFGIAAREMFPDPRQFDSPGFDGSSVEPPPKAAPQDPEPEPAPDPVPAPAPATKPEPESVPVSDSSPPPVVDPPRPSPPPKPTAPPVKVKVAAGDYNFLYLKIGSKVRMLEPAVEVELVPGKHKLRIRENPKDKWQSVSVVIPKKPCRVVFKRPYLADVRPL